MTGVPSKAGDLKKRNGLSVNTILILIILLALAVRIGAAFSREALNGDELVYARMADELAQGNGLIDMYGKPSTLFLPLLPIFIAAASFILQSIPLSGYAVEALFGSLLVIPTYLLGRELAGQRTGLMAGALVAVLPLSVEYSTKLYTEGVYTFFLILGSYFFFRLLKRGGLYLAPLAGGAIGLAYLANPSGTYYAGAFALLMAVLALRSSELRPRLIRALPLFLALFAVLAFPYVLYLHGQLGQWTYTGKSGSDTIVAAQQGVRWFTPEYEKIISGLSPDGTQVMEPVNPDSSNPALVFLKHPVLYGKIFAQNLYVFYSEQLPLVIPLWLLPLLGLGLFGAGWDRQRLKAIGYTLLLIFPLFLIFAIEYRARFFVPYVPLFMIWTAEGWRRLEIWGSETAGLIWREGAARERITRWLPALLAVLVLVPVLAFTAVQTARQGYNTGLKATGEWIRDIAGPGKRIMDRELVAAYYADGTGVLIPYADYERTTNYARLQDTDYLVIGRQALIDFRPDLRVLLDSSQPHPDWRLVHTEAAPDEVLVFELVK